MILFDGTNLSSIIKSLSKTLGLFPKQFLKEIRLFLLLNRPKLINGNLSLTDFFEHCKEGNIFIDAPLFDRVIFFHKTSLIDNGIFLREKGLLDLDNLLYASSPLNQYLKNKGVEFFIEDKVSYVYMNGKTHLLKDLPCLGTETSKNRIIGRFMKPEGITGFLFLSDAKNNTTYEKINNVPEFLCDLNECKRGIADEWRKISEPAILKCKVEIEIWNPFSKVIYEREEKSYELAEQGFLYLVDAFGKHCVPNISLRTDGYYPSLTHGFGVPPTSIKAIIELSNNNQEMNHVHSNPNAGRL